MALQRVQVQQLSLTAVLDLDLDDRPLAPRVVVVGGDQPGPRNRPGPCSCPVRPPSRSLTCAADAEGRRPGSPTWCGRTRHLGRHATRVGDERWVRTAQPCSPTPDRTYRERPRP